MWVGETRWLAATGRRIRYTAHTESFSARTLLECIDGDGVVLLHGGGNLGDLWPAHHALREAVVEQCHGRRIVQLPQSIHFGDPAALRRSARILSAHPDLTIMCRDAASEVIAREELGCRAVRSPDAAFAADITPPAAPPRRDVQWLMRDDHEGPNRSAPGEGEEDDWAASGFGSVPVYEAGRRTAHRLGQVAKRLGGIGRPAQPALLRLADALAASRVDFGVRLLSSGRVVVTDRLHGHVLSILLGIPHVVLDTQQGKVRDLYDTWTSGLDAVRWCDDHADAEEVAHRLLAEVTTRGRPPAA